MKTVAQLVREASADLSGCSDTPRLDAELLAMFAFSLSRTELISKGHQIPREEANRSLRGYVARRKRGEPLAYITGRREFWGLNFYLTPDVLIPRPETELLVEGGLSLCHELWGERKSRLCLLDLGTGSGCIAAALAHGLKSNGVMFNLLAVDNSARALEVARRNIACLGLSGDISVLQSDWFSALADKRGLFDLILSNPPYLAAGVESNCLGLSYEPPDALYSGASGLDAITSIIKTAPYYLRPGGRLFIEIGSSQAAAITKLLPQLWPPCSYPHTSLLIRKDLAGLDRLVVIGGIMCGSSLP